MTLKSVTRDITSENNTVKISGFQYKKNNVDLAARLATLQEVQNACNTTSTLTNGELDICDYIFENTKYSSNSYPSYGTWLETPHSTRPEATWDVNSTGRRRVIADNLSSDYAYGIRPVIEVAKTDIEY